MSQPGSKERSVEEHEGTDLAVLRRELAEARRSVAALQQQVEEDARSLSSAQEELRQTAGFLTRVLGTMSSAVLVADAEGRLTSVNPAACELLCCWEHELLGRPATEVLCDGASCPDPTQSVDNVERSLTLPSGGSVPVLFSSSPLFGEGGALQSTVYVAADLTQQKALEVHLRHSQKLESVGQLAAGVAHEINTPIQFVGDSLVFLQDTFQDMARALASARLLAAEVRKGGAQADVQHAAFERILAEADLDFLLGEAPAALARAREGIGRVTRIVRAMKAFAHPGQTERAPADLEAAIETTLTVATSEYRYVADVETHFGGLPHVLCNVGDINQVVLNLIVNAAHAIEEKVARTGGRGRISVSTAVAGGHALIRVADTGGGIPAAVRGRVFDPFFTTKPVGKGTGQGLSLAHNIVVARHGGRISFETVEGAGTVFEVALPLAIPETRHAA